MKGGERIQIQGLALQLKVFLLVLCVVTCVWAVSPQNARKPPKPLTRAQVEGLVSGGVNTHRVAMLVQERGIDFEPTEDFLRALQKAGADDVLLKALRTAKQPNASAPTQSGPTAAPKPGAQSDQAATAQPERPATPAMSPSLTEQLILAAELGKKKLWPQAEEQYRAALKLDPQNAAVHFALGHVLAEQQKWEVAIAEYRETLRLSPNDADAHRTLGLMLEQRRDMDGAIAEYREALRLNPDDADLDSRLGAALYAKGDLNGAIDAYRLAILLKPNDAEAHNRVGLALYVASDLEGAIGEYRRALELKPDYLEAHNNLGDALLQKGDRQGALEQYRMAYDLAPNDSTFRAVYPQILEKLKQQH